LSRQRFVTDEEAELLDLFDQHLVNVPLLVKEFEDAIREDSKQPLTEAAFATEIERFMTAVERGEADAPTRTEPVF
jgi:hypothetical protein